MSTVYYGRGRQFIWDRIQRAIAIRTPLHRMFDLMFEHFFLNDFPRFGKRVFLEHNSFVKRISPSDNFLEFEAKDGWAPLCEFLGKEIPDHPYPRVNDTQSFRALFKLEESRRKAIAYSAAVVILPVALIGGLIWRRTWGR